MPNNDKKIITFETKPYQKEESIYIETFVDEIKDLTKCKKFHNIDQQEYFGKVIIHIQNGKFHHVEINETRR